MRHEILSSIDAMDEHVFNDLFKDGEDHEKFSAAERCL